MDQKARECAIHEAGHAVVGHFSILGPVSIINVMIDPDAAHIGGRVCWVPDSYSVLGALPDDPDLVRATAFRLLSEMRSALDEGRVVTLNTVLTPLESAIAHRLRNYVIALSGFAAQVRINPKCSVLSSDDAKEMKSYEAGLRAFHDDLEEGIQSVCRAVADQCLEAHWPSVERVADALLDHCILTGSEVVRLIHG